VQSLGTELKRDETTLVLVSNKRAITKEWKFFVYKNQILTGSLYLVGEERLDETIRGGYLGNYLSAVFCPSELVSRICPHDRYLRVRGRALCLGTWFFWLCWRNACDWSAIVEFGAKAAWEDYEAVNRF
jgi:hypothetical protein